MPPRAPLPTLHFKLSPDRLRPTPLHTLMEKLRDPMPLLFEELFWTTQNDYITQDKTALEAGGMAVLGALRFLLTFDFDKTIVDENSD